MVTKFPERTKKDMDNWSYFFHAADQWREAWLIMQEDKSKNNSWLFYVESHILYFSLELFIKSIISYHINDFDAKKELLGHSATKIINKYKNIVSIFNKIDTNKVLVNLIKEYENTLSTRFGDTGAMCDGGDEKLIIDTIDELREYMCRQTGLRSILIT